MCLTTDPLSTCFKENPYKMLISLLFLILFRQGHGLKDDLGILGKISIDDFPLILYSFIKSIKHSYWSNGMSSLTIEIQEARAQHVTVSDDALQLESAVTVNLWKPSRGDGQLCPIVIQCGAFDGHAGGIVLGRLGIAIPPAGRELGEIVSADVTVPFQLVLEIPIREKGGIQRLLEHFRGKTVVIPQAVPE